MQTSTRSDLHHKFFIQFCGLLNVLRRHMKPLTKILQTVTLTAGLKEQ